MKYKALLFDLDGTLILSDPYHFRAWNAFAARYGRSISEEEYSQFITGKTNAAILHWFFDGKEMTPSQTDAMALEKEQLYYALFAPDIKPVHGALGLMQKAREAGLKLGIVTNGLKQNIDFLFTHVPINSMIDVTISSADVRRGKPDPEPYLTAASRLHLLPEECLVFEDSPTGLQSAAAAGMNAVAMLSSFPEETLRPSLFCTTHFGNVWDRINENDY